MKLGERICLVGSGALGMNLTNEYDCNVYLLDTGDGFVLVDCGSGLESERILGEIRRDGIDPAGITHIVVTHAHADHAGGAAGLSRSTGAAIVCSPQTAAILGSGDEAAIYLPESRRAGLYPEDYRLESCVPTLTVSHLEEMKAGEITLQFISAPGHSDDMICCYVKQWQALFCSDLVFHGGRIAMLPTPEFSLYRLSQSVRILAEYAIEGLYPGHLSPVRTGGDQVVRKVNATFESLRIPPNIV